MKIRILILTLVCSISFFTNCSNDDAPDASETFNGIWNLKNVSGGFQGVNVDYKRGVVKWNFNLKKNTLIVENNTVTTAPEDVYAGISSGTYDIEIKQNGDIHTLFINDTERGIIILLNTNLKIDDGLGFDGFVTEFER